MQSDQNKSNAPNKTSNSTSHEEKAKKMTDQIIDLNYAHMDDYNKKAAKVLKNEGIDAAINHMFTDQETGRQLSYAEMRARYG
jgi:hypothetical protein